MNCAPFLLYSGLLEKLNEIPDQYWMKAPLEFVY